MNFKRIIMLGFMFLLVGGVAVCGAAVGTAQKASNLDTQLIQSDFGLFNGYGTDNEEFVSTKTVPLVPGQSFGWVMELSNNKSKVHWREELILPAAPQTWSIENTDKGSYRISDDKRISVMEREVEPTNGVISNVWEIMSGDPKGHYTIRVIVDGRIEQVYEFEVE